MKSETISDIRDRLASVDATKEPYRVDDVTKAFDVHPQTVYKAIRLGQLPAVRFQGRYEISAEGILQWRKRSAVSTT